MLKHLVLTLGLLTYFSRANGIINIAVYYESLCPDSQRFITNGLTEAFLNFKEITNIILVPFGKANYTWSEADNSWYFQCQHNEAECHGNRLHNCLIYHKPKVADHFEWINCSMSNIRGDVDQIAKECSSKYSISFDMLSSCANSKLGSNLLYGSGVQTNMLIPSRNYVPWIVVDNIHTDQIQKDAERNLTEFICNQYKGADKSKYCKTNSSERSFNMTRKNLWFMVMVILYLNKI